MDRSNHAWSLALSVVGFAWLLLGSFYMYGAWQLMPHTIENNRAIQASFVAASQHIRAFEQTRARLPTAGELEEWASQLPSVPYGVRAIELIPPPYPAEALELLGYPPGDTFLLGFPRHGEWEYFAGWSGRSTLHFGRGAYYVLGSFGRDLAAMLIIGAVLVLAGRLLRLTIHSSRNRFAVRLNSGQGES